MNKFIKNIEQSKVLKLNDIVDYADNQIASLTLANEEHVGMTIMAFDEGEGVSTHAAGGDGDNIEVHNILLALTADSDVETGRFGHHPIWLNFRFVRRFHAGQRPGFAQQTVFGLAILMKRQQVHFF